VATVPAGSDLLERSVLQLQAEAAVGASAPFDAATVAGLPSLLAYDLLAVEQLGAAVAATVTDDPTGRLPHELVAEVDDAVAGAVEPAVVAAPAPVLAEGDSLDGTAGSWGPDLWYLALGAYLSPEQAGQAVDSIAGDLLTPVRRGATTCAYGTFTPVAGAEGALELLLAQWTLNAPPSAGASSQRLPDGTFQLVSCDPGASVTNLPRADVVSELLARVIARIPAG
jgi:hypothetical protein